MKRFWWKKKIIYFFCYYRKNSNFILSLLRRVFNTHNPCEVNGKSTIMCDASFCSKVLKICSLNLIIHCVKYPEVIFDQFNLIHITNLDYSFQFLSPPSNDIFSGLPHIVTGIIVNFTESLIQKIWTWYDLRWPQVSYFAEERIYLDDFFGHPWQWLYWPICHATFRSLMGPVVFT